MFWWSCWVVQFKGSGAAAELAATAVRPDGFPEAIAVMSPAAKQADKKFIERLMVIGVRKGIHRIHRASSEDSTRNPKQTKQEETEATRVKRLQLIQPGKFCSQPDRPVFLSPFSPVNLRCRARDRPCLMIRSHVSPRWPFVNRAPSSCPSPPSGGEGARRAVEGYPCRNHSNAPCTHAFRTNLSGDYGVDPLVLSRQENCFA